MNKQQTAVEWLQDKLKETYDKEGKLPLAYTLSLVKQAKEMEHEQAKRIALHFIVLGGQECGCNWNEMNFTDEFNKVINNKRSV